jgi:hypothetical protein
VIRITYITFANMTRRNNNKTTQRRHDKDQRRLE